MKFTIHYICIFLLVLPVIYASLDFSYSSDMLYEMYSDGTIKLYSNNELGSKSQNNYYGSLKSILTGDINGIPFTMESTSFTWNWHIQSEFINGSGWVNITELDDKGNPINIPVYLINETYNDYVIGFNNDSNLNWTRTVKFSRTRIDNITERFYDQRPKITDIIKYSYRNFDDVKLRYINEIEEGSSLLYNNQVSIPTSASDIILTENLNGSNFNFLGMYRFNYQDLIDSDLNISEVRIGNGLSVGLTDSLIISVQAELNNPSIGALSGGTITIDPSVTSYSLPTATGDPEYDDWTNPDNILTDNGQYAQSDLVGETLDTSGYSFSGLTDSDIIGIEWQAECKITSDPFPARCNIVSYLYDRVTFSWNNQTFTNANTWQRWKSQEGLTIKTLGDAMDNLGRLWYWNDFDTNNFRVRNNLSLKESGSTGCNLECDYEQTRVSYLPADTIPPEISIVSMPAGTIDIGNITFNWTVTDDDDTTIETFLYISDNLEDLNTSLVYYANDTNNSNHFFNFTHPKIDTTDTDLVRYYPFDNQLRWGENTTITWEVKDMSFNYKNLQSIACPEENQSEYLENGGIIEGARHFSFPSDCGSTWLATSGTYERDWDADINHTYSFWVYLNKADQHFIFDQYGEGTGYKVYINETGYIGFYEFNGIDDPNIIWSDTNLSLNEWYHIAIVYYADDDDPDSDDDAYIYINNELVGSGSNDFADDTGIFYIGLNFNNHGNFTLDEMAEWDRALNSSELYDLYYPTENKLLYYKIDAVGFEEGNHTVEEGNLTIEDYYMLNITDPLTSDPDIVSDGDNITIKFDYSVSGTLITSDVTVDNVTINDSIAEIVNTTYTEDLWNINFTGFESGNFVVEGWVNDSDDFEIKNTGCKTGSYCAYVDPIASPNHLTFTENYDVSTYDYCSVEMYLNRSNASCSAGQGICIDVSYDGGSSWSNSGSTILASDYCYNCGTDPVSEWVYKVYNETDLSSYTNFTWRLRAFAITGGVFWIDDINVTCYRSYQQYNQLWHDGSDWNVNVTVPSGLSGLQNLTVYATYNTRTRNDTEIDAIYYGGEDTEKPYITLNQPLNNTNTTDTDILFNWTVTDDTAINLSCNLTINGVENVTGIISGNGSSSSIEVTGFNYGSYYWWISCNDSFYNTNTSVTFYFNVSEYIELPPVIPPTGLFAYNTSLPVGSCPSSVPGVYSLFIAVFFGLMVVLVGFLFHWLAGAFGAVVLFILSWTLLGCSFLVGLIVLLLSLYLFIKFVS